ncbi:hypothetical protein NDU88_010056 [Pleurodeles waltl]|uniref:Uncharacterized protein n=1 Tax=Pleurodeles waltl TaxID=8319 RepID=A0AAV7QTC6_PLEWA|nr:hypothetical protein NDU88_010056 [Pleurodeles waltl]
MSAKGGGYSQKTQVQESCAQGPCKTVDPCQGQQYGGKGQDACMPDPCQGAQTQQQQQQQSGASKKY